MTNIPQHKFEPGARSIIQMGEELIGHPTTAINELVKNGYDADATEVKVFVHYSKDNSQSFVVISDDGLGMNAKTLFGDWLQPSVSKKRLGSGKSQVFQRNLLGSKGIGRLASMALGRYLTVITKTADETDYNWIFIDRENFKEERLLSSIEFPGSSTRNIKSIFIEEEITRLKSQSTNFELLKYLKSRKLENFKEGTIIIVENLDDSIRTIIEDEFLNGDIEVENMSLVRSLRILVTPLLLNPKIQQELIDAKILDEKLSISLPESVFHVAFGSNLLSDLNLINDSFRIEQFSILSNFDYRILGKVLEDGSVSAVYNCNRLPEDTFSKGIQLSNKDVFSEESSRGRKLTKIDTPKNDNPRVGAFFFDIRIYDRDIDAIEKLAKLLKASGRREATYLLDEIVGLRISKDGFGVKPYGEEEKDWMGLGQMRVQDPSMIIGSNQMIGNIFLFTPENESLKEKTNREGFYENEAFITFKKILRAILIEVGKKRYNYRTKHSIGRKISSKHQRPDTTRFLEFIKNITNDTKVINQASSYVKEINTTLDNLENSLTFSQRLATLGSGLELVYHEMAQPIGIIGKCLFALKFPTGKVRDLDVREELLAELNQIRESNSTLDKLKESLEPAIGKSRKTNFKPVDIFSKICYLLTSDIIDYKIEIEIDPLIMDFSINDYEYNIWVAFLNIINNAIYWLKLEDNKPRKIIFKKTNINELIISNTGPKIPSDELENIFNYGVSHKKEKNATGLGLAFTRSLLTSNGWEIVAENFEDGPAFILKKINH